MTERGGFVACGALVSLSTTVSLLLLSAMAFTRHQVVASPASQSRAFRWASAHGFAASLVPWAVGIVVTSLHFVDFTSAFGGGENVRWEDAKPES